MFSPFVRFVNGSPEGSPSVVVLRGVPACLSFEFFLRCIALSICKGRRGSIPRRVWRHGCFAGSPSLRPCLVCYVCRVLFDLGLALQPWSCSSLVWTLGIAPRPPYRLKDKKKTYLQIKIILKQLKKEINLFLKEEQIVVVVAHFGKENEIT